MWGIPHGSLSIPSHVFIIPVSSRLSLLRFGRRRNALGRSGVLRVVIGAWLAVHAFVIAAAPVADAMAGHAEAVVAHWEDAQETSCPPQHDQSACQLCQVVTGSFGGTISEREAPVRLARVAGPPARDAGPHAAESALIGSPDPRGPPRV